MFWIKLTLLILTYPSCIRLHTTSCTEDLHCSIGYYCEENIHSCRECLRCEDFKREAAAPSVACVKSLLECGKCFEGLTQAYEVYTQCIPISTERPTAVLPLYAWLAIAVSLVLMVTILCLFAKIKNLKFAYATSVQSLHTSPMMQSALAPPPAYHDIDSVAPSSPSDHSEAFEMQKLVETPYPCETLPSPDMRPRENSSSQNARVFNNPAYVRAPQHGTRPNSPYLSVAIRDEVGGNNTSAGTTGDASATKTDATWVVRNTTGNGNVANTLGGGRRGDKIQSSSLQGVGQQDTNNNYSGEEESGHSNGSAAHCTSVVAGPSFVINVVENINNTISTHAQFNT
ncbi:hypothetical protein evm_011074 [Chilo suppressalis]|nr:hypothetical protein evm_011074 [Chilo suppressalis]